MPAMKVCPGCEGTGSGLGNGVSGGGGMCTDCLGGGEVTETKRERLLARNGEPGWQNPYRRRTA